MQPTPPPPEGGRWAVGCFRKMAVAPPHIGGVRLGRRLGQKTIFLIVSRSQTIHPTPVWRPLMEPKFRHGLDQKTEMACFGVQTLVGPRPLPILPWAGVESKKGAKCDIIRRQNAKKGVTKAKKRAVVKNFALRERSPVAGSDDFSL